MCFSHVESCHRVNADVNLQSFYRGKVARFRDHDKLCRTCNYTTQLYERNRRKNILCYCYYFSYTWA